MRRGELIGFGQLLFFLSFFLFFLSYFLFFFFFSPSFIPILLRTHARPRFFFSSRKPGEFGQYIKHTRARTTIAAAVPAAISFPEN